MIKLRIVLNQLLSYILPLLLSLKIINRTADNATSVGLETNIERFLGIEQTVDNVCETKKSINNNHNINLIKINDSNCDDCVTKIYHCRQLESWDCGKMQHTNESTTFSQCTRYILFDLCTFSRKAEPIFFYKELFHCSLFIVHCYKGIACIIMILRWIRCSSNDESSSKRNCFFSSSSRLFKYGHSENISKEEMTERKWMLKETKTKSIWSIDLAILFFEIMNNKKEIRPEKYYKTKYPNKNLAYSMLFCSAHLGVNPSYSNFSYYERAFSKDKCRVNERFQVANNLKIPMSRINPVLNQNGHLCLERIISIISRKDCVAIALIDNNVLFPPTAFNENILEGKDKRTSSQELQEVSYTGHYIILCGISTDTQNLEQAWKNQFGNQSERSPKSCNKCFNAEPDIAPSSHCIVIKNPGTVEAVDFFMPSHFESAWKANGTDQDVLFFRKHY